MRFSVSEVLPLARATLAEVSDDDVTTMSAAIAYYTIFSLPPLLVVIVGVAGAAFGAETVQEALLGQASGLVGPEGSRALQTMIENASDLGSGLGAKAAGLAALLFGATGSFVQLQKALNRAWEVETVEQGWVRTILKRVLSFGMVLSIAFLLLVSLAVSAALAAMGDAASALAPEGPVRVLLGVVNALISLGVITVLFAALFRTLPDAQIAWRDVWVGALVTALLFTVGKLAIGLYLGQADPGSAFGAAGSLALVLVWIYYSALILLVGAEFTQVWSRRFGTGIRADDSSPLDLFANAEGTSTDATPRSSQEATDEPASRGPLPFRQPGGRHTASSELDAGEPER